LFTEKCFPLVTQYTNVKHLFNATTVTHINDKQSNTVRQYLEDFANFQ